MKLFRCPMDSSSDTSQNAAASDAMYKPFAAKSVASSMPNPNPLNFAVIEVILPVKRVDSTPVESAMPCIFFCASPEYPPMIWSNAEFSADTSAADSTESLPKSQSACPALAARSISFSNPLANTLAMAPFMTENPPSVFLALSPSSLTDFFAFPAESSRFFCSVFS